jgi:hypothetical protein
MIVMIAGESKHLQNFRVGRRRRGRNALTFLVIKGNFEFFDVDLKAKDRRRRINI